MLLLYYPCHPFDLTCLVFQLNELLYTVAKVEQAFTVSPRTSSDRHQLEKVASATPLEGQLAAELDSAVIHQLSSYDGPCTWHEAGAWPGCCWSTERRAGHLVCLAEQRIIGSLMSTMWQASPGMQLWPPLVP